MCQGKREIKDEKDKELGIPLIHFTYIETTRPFIWFKITHWQTKIQSPEYFQQQSSTVRQINLVKAQTGLDPPPSDTQDLLSVAGKWINFYTPFLLPREKIRVMRNVYKFM